MDEDYQKAKRELKADPANREKESTFFIACRKLGNEDFYCHNCQIFGSDIEPHPCPYSLEIEDCNDLCNCCPCVEQMCGEDI